MLHYNPCLVTTWVCAMSDSMEFLSKSKLDSLLETFISRATQRAHAGSPRLWISGFPCGWVFPAAVQTLADSSDVVLDEAGLHIGRGLPPGEAINPLLATVAQKLRLAGQAPGWRNELLDVWSDHKRIGAIERGVMRPLGLLTQAVHLNAWNERGQLWVARRALTKATDPGMWDTLVGGLVGHAEPEDLALVRESEEEAGLAEHQITQRTPLRKIAQMQRQLREGYQMEDVLTSECVLPEDVIPQNQDGEVMEIVCLSPVELVGMIQTGQFTHEASIVILEDLRNRATC